MTPFQIKYATSIRRALKLLRTVIGTQFMSRMSLNIYLAYSTPTKYSKYFNRFKVSGSVARIFSGFILPLWTTFTTLTLQKTSPFAAYKVAVVLLIQLFKGRLGFSQKNKPQTNVVQKHFAQWLHQRLHPLCSENSQVTDFFTYAGPEFHEYPMHAPSFDSVKETEQER